MKKIILSFVLLLLQNLVFAEQILDSATAAEGWRRELAFRQERDSIIRQSMGKPYVDFSVQSLNGETFTNDQLKGKVLFITFWTECCSSCIDNINELKALYSEYKNNPDVQFISIARSDAGVIKEMVQKYDVPYPVCPVEGSIVVRLSYKRGAPLNIIVDKAGNMVLYKFGPINNQDKKPFFDQFQQVIDGLLSVKG